MKCCGGPVGIGYLRPDQFLDHLTVIINENSFLGSKSKSWYWHQSKCWSRQTVLVIDVSQMKGNIDITSNKMVERVAHLFARSWKGRELRGWSVACLL